MVNLPLVMRNKNTSLVVDGSIPQVWFVDVGVCAGVLQSWQNQNQALDSETIVRLERIKNEQERTTRFTTHCALRVLIECIKGPRWRGKPLTYSDKGQPSIPGFGWALSLSHTHQAGLIALSPGACVGVDIELRNRHIKMQPQRQQAIISAAMALSQAGEVASTPLPFITAWVRLEAYAKATGLGLAPLLTKVMAPLRKGDTQTTGDEIDSFSDSLAVVDLEVAPDFVAAVALDPMDPAPTVHSFPHDLSEFVD